MKRTLLFVLSLVLLLCGSPNALASVRGDIDGDGRVLASDVRYVLRVANGLEKNIPGGKYAACDLNGDNRITEADALILLWLGVGLDPETAPERSLPTESAAEETAAAAQREAVGSDAWDKPWGAVPGALPEGETGKYAVNTNTGKFHYASCEWAGQILPKNRTDSNADREEIIAAGYTPCKVCTP